MNTQLIEDNLKLVYAFSSRNNIFDEDIIQDLMLKFCQTIDYYDPDKGALSTFVWKVLENELKNIYTRNSKQVPVHETVSLDSNAFKEDDMLLEELIGEDDNTLELFELNESFKTTLEQYKKQYPDTWETDINVFFDCQKHVDKIKIAKNRHIKYYKITSTYQQVFNFFRNSVKV